MTATLATTRSRSSKDRCRHWFAPRHNHLLQLEIESSAQGFVASFAPVHFTALLRWPQGQQHEARTQALTDDIQKKVGRFFCLPPHPATACLAMRSVFRDIQENALEDSRAELQQSKADADESKAKHEAAIESITKTNCE